MLDKKIYNLFKHFFMFIKQTFIKIFKFLGCLSFYLIINSYGYAESNIDQWQDSQKTYYDLIQEGFEVKAYDTSKIEMDNQLLLILFVTVLQKNSQVYECQEYQTLDQNMTTLDLAFVCRKLVQPYEIGLDT